MIFGRKLAIASLLNKWQWRQIVTFRSVQCYSDLTYIFNSGHAGTLALMAERQSARMSKIKNELNLDCRV